MASRKTVFISTTDKETVEIGLSITSLHTYSIHNTEGTHTTTHTHTHSPIHYGVRNSADTEILLTHHTGLG